MKYQHGRVDITQGEAVLSAAIGEQIILSKHKGKPWTVGQDADLQDICTAAVALLRFLEARQTCPSCGGSMSIPAGGNEHKCGGAA